MEHVFECSVIVVGVRSGGFVGEERRRVQELHVGLDCGLVEVVGLGLITCGEEELVRRVHNTLFVRSAQQVYHRLHVVEEEEKGRKVEQEVETDGEETAHVNMNMEMG